MYKNGRPVDSKPESEKYRFLEYVTLSFQKEPTEQAKTPNTLAPRIADSFRMIRNNAFSGWLISPSCEEGYPKEGLVLRTELAN